jgi:hypothetical protein
MVAWPLRFAATPRNCSPGLPDTFVGGRDGQAVDLFGLYAARQAV